LPGLSAIQFLAVGMTIIGVSKWRDFTYRKFKQPFFLIGALSPARRVVNRLSVDENPNVASAGLGGVVVGGARSVPDRAAARTQSERHRRLALASGFRLSDCLE
jgi:hypothetical protein